MNKHHFIPFLIAALFLSFILPSTNVSAKEAMSLGEIKAIGVVSIESSVGKWVELKDAYPLLKSTKLKTNEGVVSVTTKEGTRIDLSKNTEVSIDAASNSYTLTLAYGTVSFNIMPSSEFIIITRDATISAGRQVAGYYSMVAGPGAPRLSNIQGMIFSDSKGTLIRSITGRINVSGEGFQAKVLDSGESFFASVGGEKSPLGYTPAAGSGAWLTKGLIMGGFFVSAGLTANESFRGNGTHSKSAP